MKHMGFIRSHTVAEFGMLFAQEFVTSGILAMHCGGCGIIDIFIQADLANANSGHLGVAREACGENLGERVRDYQNMQSANV